MSLKDTLTSLAGAINQKNPAVQNQNTSQQDRNDDAIRSIIDNESFPIFRKADMDITKYTPIPLSGIAALGAAFAQLPEAARTVVQTATTKLPLSGKVYVGISPTGGTGKLLIKDNVTVGNITQKGKQGIAARMRFMEISDGLPVTTTSMTAIPFDPMTIVVAAALMRIEQRMDALQKAAEEILHFLKLEKQSKQRGNLNMLYEILEEYKRDCTNEQRRALRNAEVQTIKREAHQDLLFYSEQIAHRLKGRQGLHVAQQAQGLLDAVMSEFCEYQLACYIYAFASFLDVMLLKSFEAPALNAVARKLNECAARYAELYAQCHSQIADYQKTSVESQLLGGLGNAAKSLGQALSAVSFLRERSVDEALINAGKSMHQQNDASIAKQMERFATLGDPRMQPFIDNVQTIDCLYNRPNSMLMDEDNIYVLKTA